jgi:hypothetical protein
MGGGGTVDPSLGLLAVEPLANVIALPKFDH